MNKFKKILIGMAGLFVVIIVCMIWPNQSTTLSHEVIIDAPIERVYETLIQIDNVDEWVDEVQKADYISEVKYGKGAFRQCTFEDGGIVQEEVTDAVENQLIRMRMSKHDLPVEYFEWEIQTTPIHEEATKVKQTTQYKVQMGLLGVILNQTAVEPNLDATLANAYQNLKGYIEAQNE